MRELDDIGGGGHAGACQVPAVLAAAELSEGDGRDVLLGLVAGHEITSRLTDAASYDVMTLRGWHTTGVYGSIGAAVAAARGALPRRRAHRGRAGAGRLLYRRHLGLHGRRRHEQAPASGPLGGDRPHRGGAGAARSHRPARGARRVLGPALRHLRPRGVGSGRATQGAGRGLSHPAQGLQALSRVLGHQ